MQNPQPSYETIRNLNRMPVSQKKCQGRHACMIYEKTKISSLVVALDQLSSDLEIERKPELRRYANLFITHVQPCSKVAGGSVYIAASMPARTLTPRALHHASLTSLPPQPQPHPQHNNPPSPSTSSAAPSAPGTDASNSAPAAHTASY